jgi:hypothetical protein
MAWTQSQIDTLEAHIARGTTRVDYGNHVSITYGSIDEMLRLLATMKNEVSAASATPPARRSYVSFSRR